MTLRSGYVVGWSDAPGARPVVFDRHQVGPALFRSGALTHCHIGCKENGGPIIDGLLTG